MTPDGRTPGAPNRVSALAQRLMDEPSEEVIMALIQATKGGDVAASNSHFADKFVGYSIAATR